jgi:hypothetical protein
MQKINKLEALLDRFGYEAEFKLGFAFYLGGASLVGLTGQPVEDILEARRQLAEFDINEEYEELLGPLRDYRIQCLLEEFVWRTDADIQPRQVMLPNMSKPVTEFTFKNHKLLGEDDAHISTMADASSALQRIFESIGEELLENEYDILRAYKSGMCFFNVKAQVDTRATQQIIILVSSMLPPIPSAIELFARQPNYDFDAFTDIQIPLLHFIQPLDEEFARMVWAYQSWVFYKDGAELSHIPSLELGDFMLSCREAAFRFLEQHQQAVYLTSEKGVHHRMFPALDPNQDERRAIIEGVHAAWGYPLLDNNSDLLTSKALFVFAYFCAMCETVLQMNLGHQSN